MSGGSNDDAVLAIGHRNGRVAVVDLVAKQIGAPPFDPRNAVTQFCGMLKDYGIARVSGDAFAGTTFRHDFQARGVSYHVRGRSASDLYEALEPRLNAGEVELLDHATLIEQACCLVWRGGKIGHEPNGHDDHANAVAGLVNVLCDGSANVVSAGCIVVSPQAVNPAAAWSASGGYSDPSATGWRRFDHQGPG
jgi:hypothetical protein